MTVWEVRFGGTHRLVRADTAVEAALVAATGRRVTDADVQPVTAGRAAEILDEVASGAWDRWPRRCITVTADREAP